MKAGTWGFGTVVWGVPQVGNPEDVTTALHTRQAALKHLLAGSTLSVDKLILGKYQSPIKLETKPHMLVRYVLALDDNDYQCMRQGETSSSHRIGKYTYLRRLQIGSCLLRLAKTQESSLFPT